MNVSGEFEPQGSLKIVFGPMYSSKSVTLIADITKEADIGMKVLYINHSSDVRDTEKQDDYVTTHSSGFRCLSDKITALKATTLTEIPESIILEHDVIGIDEGQFFPDIVPKVRSWVLDFNRIVYIASLDGDWRMMPFGKVNELICIANSVVKICAKCVMCRHKVGNRIISVDAHFTGKIGGDLTKVVEIGAADKYVPLCLPCHRANMNKKK
jgi:thymidine kinase